MLDILITNGIVITMEGPGVGIINDGAVGIQGNRIAVVGQTSDVLRAHKAHRYIDATRRVVMPGLIDAHLHSALAVLRGLAQDVKNWMQQAMWPFDEALTVDEIIPGSMMNLVEAVKAGTTTICDYDSPMD